MPRDLKMPNINLVVMDGNLTREPELKHTTDGKPVCKFAIAHETYSKGESVTDYWECVCFGKTAERMGSSTMKGDAVYVEGRLSTNRWTDNKGTEQKRIEIVANNVRAMSWPKGDGTIPGEAKANTAAAPGGHDEDIPF